MSYEFKVGDKGKTRDGRDYEVVAVVPKLEWPLIVVVDHGGGKFSVGKRYADGAYFDIQSDDFDLIPPPRVVWVNFRINGEASYYSSAAAANTHGDFPDEMYLARAVRVELPA